MSKHTPGPWIVCINSLDQMITIEQDASALGENDGCAVMVVDCVADMGDGLNREIALANANILAAAPELLEVLEEALDHFLECNCGESCEGTCTYSRAKRAIAKAKPEEA